MQEQPRTGFRWGDWKLAAAESLRSFRTFEQVVGDCEDWVLSEEPPNYEDIIDGDAPPADFNLYAYLDIRIELDGLLAANRLHRRQMVVHAATLFEGMILNFLENLFQTRTDAMYSYLGHGDLKGRVSIKTITASRSLSELVQALARQAAAALYAKPYSKMLTELERLTKHPFEPHDLRSELLAALDARNRIVHESSAEEIDAEFALCSLQASHKLAEHLLHVTMLMDLPVDEVESLRDYEAEYDHTKDWPQADCSWRRFEGGGTDVDYGKVGGSGFGMKLMPAMAEFYRAKESI